MTFATATTSPTTESSSSAQLPPPGFLFGESSFATDLNDLDPQQQPSPQSPRGTGNNNKNNHHHASFQSSSSKTLLQRLSFSSASGSSDSHRSDTSFVSAVSTESAAAALPLSFSSLPAVTTPTFSGTAAAPMPGASLNMATNTTYHAHAVMSTPISSNSAWHASSPSAAAPPISNAAFPQHAGSNSANSTSLPPFMGRGRRVGVAMVVASKSSSLKHPPPAPVVSEALGQPESEERATVMEHSTHCRAYASVPAPSLVARDYSATSRGFTKSSRSSSSSSLNLVQWLEHECPFDVVPKVLAFMGPQSFAALSRTNRHWKGLLQLESTWKVLCEELYKWQEGDPEPHSWKELYRLSPCVPVDYSTIPAALALANTLPPTAPLMTAARARFPTRASRHHGARRGERHHHPTNNNNNDVSSVEAAQGQLQRRSVRVLLRPGRYYLRQAITVQAIAGIHITIETMKLPASYYYSEYARQQQAHFLLQQQQQRAALHASRVLLIDPPPPPPASPRSHALCFLRCVRADNDVVHGHGGGESLLDGSHGGLGDAYSVASSHSTGSGREALMWGAPSDRPLEGQRMTSHIMNSPPPPPSLTQATIVLHTRRHNEPAFLVRQGHLVLKDLEINHNCHGIDIWNGNSALQLQPSLAPEDAVAPPVPEPPLPSATLERVKVTSQSGRGIVCIDGGNVVIRNCAVHDCAATGVYIGGPGGSRAVLERTDVIRNGIGSRHRHHHRRRRGGGAIARGHSGVYLEQGHARIVDCNISHNSLTGISAVSPTHAILHLQDSDLMANGTYQLEMPPLGTTARRRSVTQNVNLQVAPAQGGNGSSTSLWSSSSMRSGLFVPEDPVGAAASSRHHDWLVRNDDGLEQI